MGEALVKNEDKTCKITAINSNDNDVTIEIEPKEVFKFDTLPSIVSSSESDREKESDSQEEGHRYTRHRQILKLLKTGHLSVSKNRSVKRVIKKQPNVFLLPGEPLPSTNLVEHEIQLENDVPINIKQYRSIRIISEERYKSAYEMESSRSQIHRITHQYGLYPRNRRVMEIRDGESL